MNERVTALEKKCVAGESSRLTKNNTGLFVSGEAIFWKAEQAGLEFAVTENDLSPNVDGKDVIPKPKYKWGFRAGLGYNTPFDGWDLYLTWTRLQNRIHKTVTPPAGGLMHQTISSQATTPFAPDLLDSASDRFRLRLNIVDLELGREFFISRWLALRPFIGPRAAWVKERSHVTYIGGDFALSGISPDNIVFRNDFWGVGPRAGINTQWSVGGGVSLFGDAAASLLVGRYNKLSVAESGGTPQVLLHRIRDNYDVTKFVFDIFAGLRWAKAFADDYLGVELHAGWECHFFSNQWQWQSATFSPTPNGDLTLSGLTFGGRLDF